MKELQTLSELEAWREEVKIGLCGENGQDMTIIY